MKCELKLIKHGLFDMALSKIAYFISIGVLIGVLVKCILPPEYIYHTLSIVYILLCTLILILYIAARVECKRMKHEVDE